jgi:hypothetical protein
LVDTQHYGVPRYSAIISLVAFIGELFTAAIYVFAVRPLVEQPVSVGFDELRVTAAARRGGKPSSALALHTERLTASAAGTPSGAGEEPPVYWACSRRGEDADEPVNEQAAH